MEKINEVQLCEIIISFYTDYEVYKEVPAGGRIDIVVKKGPWIVAVEAKLQFNTQVIYQAMKNKQYSNYSYVAVPKPKGGGWSAIQLCKTLGVGVLFVRERVMGDRISYSIEEVQKPGYQRVTGRIILQDCMKEAIAGASYNTQSEFKVSIRQLENILQRTGSIKAKKLFGENKFHYSHSQSAMQCICRLINHGALPQFGYESGNIFLKENK